MKTHAEQRAADKAQKVKALLEHPALWQAAKHPMAGHNNYGHNNASQSKTITQTGFKALDNILCHKGWPLGQLIECLSLKPGSGELDLFLPAIRQLHRQTQKSTASSNQQQNEAPIVLIAPPYIPCMEAWQQHMQQAPQLWCVTTRTLDERLWAAEQVLQSNSANVVMLWLYQQSVKPVQLRRLQLAAKRSQSLVVMFRDKKLQQQASPAPLRLSLTPVPSSRQTALLINILKQPGNWGGQRISIPWHSRLQYPSLPIDQWPVYIPAEQSNSNAMYPNSIKLPQLDKLATSNKKWS